MRSNVTVRLDRSIVLRYDALRPSGRTAGPVGAGAAEDGGALPGGSPPPPSPVDPCPSPAPGDRGAEAGAAAGWWCGTRRAQPDTAMTPATTVAVVAMSTRERVRSTIRRT